MIEREVEKQVKTERPQFGRSRMAARRTLIASVAAVMVLGTTVFAGVGIYRMQREQVGSHGVDIKIAGGAESGGEAVGTESGADVKEGTAVIPDVTMEAGYLPDGMVQTEMGKYSYESALYQGGVSMVFYRMDMGDDQFHIRYGDVISSEDIAVSGYEGVYLEFPHLNPDEIAFNQRIYVAYTDVHYVMEMFVASDVTKEEALRIAEGVKLTPAGAADSENLVAAWDWSAYLKSAEENERMAETEPAGNTTIAKDQMKIHAIGESFSAEHPQTGGDQYKGLAVKVSDVQIADDLSLLDPALTDEDLRSELAGDGKLRKAEIQYIRNGGVDSLSEVVKSREVVQKLVYATVEYTNTGDSELSDVLYMGDLLRIAEKDGKMKIFSGTVDEEPAPGDTWETVVNTGASAFCEMQYYDIDGGERNNNYITAIKPGETVTVHMGWIVTEEELGNLYVSFDTYGGAYEFSDTSLAMGYVDIRQ